MACGSVCAVFDYNDSNYAQFLIVNRAWQANIHSLVKDDSHKVEVYSCLWLLLTEEDKEAFSDHLLLSLQYWGDKEPDFTQYFQTNYATRAGKYK